MAAFQVTDGCAGSAYAHASRSTWPGDSERRLVAAELPYLVGVRLPNRPGALADLDGTGLGSAVREIAMTRLDQEKPGQWEQG